MQRTVEIVVSPQGEAHLETRGFSGSLCRDASRLFEEALGKRKTEQLTAEYYGHTAVEAPQRQQQ